MTICTKDRELLLGQVIDDRVHLSTYGDIIADCWRWLPETYPYIELDEWVVMPNHLHGILVIADGRRGGSRTAPTTADANHVPKRKSIGSFIGAFKTVSTRKANAVRGTPGHPIWQRNFFDHVIRNQKSLDSIRRYISNYPAKWSSDQLYQAGPLKV